MITQTQTFSMEFGDITAFYSDKLEKRFFVVNFYDKGYINIFDEKKENEAMISLIENDSACQHRDATMRNPFAICEEEYIWGVFCALLEATNGDYRKAVSFVAEYFPCED